MINPCFWQFTPSLLFYRFLSSRLRVSPLFYKLNHGMYYSNCYPSHSQLGWSSFDGFFSHDGCRARELRRLEFAESTEPDTVLPSVRSSRRSKSLSTARMPSVVCSFTCSYACAFCGKNTVKRSCVGIWECKKCGKVVAGGAWTVATPAALTVRSSIQRLRRSKVEA